MIAAVKPMDRISLRNAPLTVSPGLTEKQRLRRRTTNSSKASLQIYPITVASAAPAAPMPGIIRGSRIILTTAPVAVPSMERPDIPSQRSRFM